MRLLTHSRARSRATWPGASGRIALLLLGFALAGCGGKEAAEARVASGEWLEFTGSWNAAGTRRSLALGSDRRASILELKGTMLLSGADRPGVGFRCELLALADSATGLVGRSVWTDERGDKVFAELVGQGTAAKNRVSGKLLGGTGRYAGAEGAYEFSWRMVVEADDGAVQGRTIDLKGRVRVGAAAGGKDR